MRKNLLFSLIALVLGVSSLPLQAQSSIPESERTALVNFYNATGGPQWNGTYHWDLSKEPSTWRGVTIKNGHVTEIFLEQGGLSGNLPAKELLALPKLETLALEGNSLEGAIPAEVGQLTSLTTLRLGSNKFSGSVPDLTALVRLENISITSMRDITGPLPDISKMPNLLFADFSFCRFSGELPKEIGKCTKMLSFDVSMNKNLSGEVPKSLGQCVALMDLSLQDNKFTGEIPDLSNLADLGKQNEFVFGRCYFNDNAFTGGFPAWVLNHASLTRFTCQHNKLSGEFPQDLSGMGNIKVIYASLNQFTGSLPKMLPATLEELDLAYNKLSGAIPNWTGPSALGVLQVQGNNLSGHIPAFYKKLSEFHSLNTSLNNFTLKNFKDWKKFASQEGAIFKAGIQKAYQKNQKVTLNSGEKLQLDATYTGDGLIGNCTYQWYQISSADIEPIKGATSPIFTVDAVTASDAFKHVCFITTDYFGSMKDYSVLDLASMVSGTYDVWVDGKSLASEVVLSDAVGESCYVYPTEVRDGRLSFVAAEQAEGFWLFDLRGGYVLAQRQALAEGIDLSGVAMGQYLAMILLRDGSWVKQVITIR